MIKCEVMIDGDSIMVNGHKFHVEAEYGYDTYYTLVDTQEEFDCIEDAIKYCMEQSK